jgi:hypothetical protein
MVYTEIKLRNGKKYFYRALSLRKGKTVSKLREYLGVNLSKQELLIKEKQADELFKLTFNKLKEKLLEEIKSKIKEVLIKNKVKKAGIFGSYARGDYNRNSDIDILIEPPKGIGFGFAGIELELEDKLKKKVDLITYDYISPYLKDRILKEEVRII